MWSGRGVYGGPTESGQDQASGKVRFCTLHMVGYVARGTLLIKAQMNYCSCICRIKWQGFFNFGWRARSETFGVGVEPRGATMTF